MKVAVVGATGLVGSVMLKVLAERNFPVSELIPVASAKSAGKQIEFKGKKYTVVTMDDAIAMKPDVALFSAGGGTSLENALHALRKQVQQLLIIHQHGGWILLKNLSYLK
jgi:aspartate-semialdehyde dehydrogenase